MLEFWDEQARDVEVNHDAGGIHERGDQRRGDNSRVNSKSLGKHWHQRADQIGPGADDQQRKPDH